MASLSSTEDMFSVKGMVAVVTGGGTGIGLMIAKGLAAAGAERVYILGRRKDVLDKAAQAHPALAALECDVSSKASLQAATERIGREVGYVNFLAANSGVYGPPSAWDPAATLEQNYETLFAGATMEDFTRALEVNVTGAFFTILAFLRLLDAGNRSAVEKGTFGAPAPGGGGEVPAVQSQVLVTSSVSAFLRHRYTPPAYGASKAAIVHLTKQAATCLAPYGIRVNALAPGFFPSEMTEDVVSSRDPATELPSNDDFIPARKFGGYEEMAGTVVYLASRAGSFNNGLILLNDGGRASVVPATY